MATIGETLGTAGAASAGASAAGATATAGASLFSASSAFSILSGASTVLSVLNANRAGEAKAAALNAQADDADTQTQIEQIQSTARQTSLKKALVQQLGERDVATAASGIDLSFGTPAIARRQDVTDSERALSIDQDTTDTRIARLRERAANYRIQAQQASAGGLGTAAALALEGGAKLLKRG
ncbi:hypothetical protein [Bradyrhizobium sp. NAS80.1]|uniref:hypothetical protein n=1 Tax=Bradyrhizobium sp. NAS80.1 TaxID=1680159 RepID=UPI0011611217|nr:hypothetical protein [Bradyrhizobium sp. NAS80.1]